MYWCELMAREHPATARSSDSFTQESHSSAAATIGNPARAATAKHANNRYVDERICIACGLRTLVGAAGIADRHSPGAHLTLSRGRSSSGSSARLDARFPLWVISRHHVRFAPNSDRESGLPRKVVSALPPKADMCGANRHVCFVPIADGRWS